MLRWITLARSWHVLVRIGIATIVVAAATVLQLAIARQTAARETEDFIERFTERIQALAANQDLLVRNEWQGVDIEDLVRAQLAHFADLLGSRIIVRGSPVCLNAAAAQAIGLAIHELATNAGKYGALSVDAGRVDVCWQVDGTAFTMTWSECDGPPVSPPEKRGFGSTVVDTMVKQTLNGEVRLDYAPSGVVWNSTCRAANVLERNALNKNLELSTRPALAAARGAVLRHLSWPDAALTARAPAPRGPESSAPSPTIGAPWPYL